MFSLSLDLSLSSVRNGVEGGVTPPIPGEPWTLSDIPAEYRVNGGLWQSKNATLNGTNQVSSLPDAWGTNDMFQNTSGGQPFYGLRNGLNAVVWPNTAGSRFLRTAGDFAPVYWMFVAEYNDGVRDTFLTLSALIGCNTTNGRIIGSSGSSNLVNSVGNFWTSELSKNVGPYTNTVLPMTMSMLEARGPALAGRWALGGVESNRAWQGPMWFAMALGIEPTGDLLYKIQGRVAWDYNLQSSLPVDHPYKTAEPTKSGPTAMSATQSGNSFVFTQGSTGSPLISASQSGNNFMFGS